MRTDRQYSHLEQEVQLLQSQYQHWFEPGTHTSQHALTGYS